MTLELWNTLATFGTFVVIAATAIAALVQLRHARGSNQIAVFTELQTAQETPQFIAAIQSIRTELPRKLKDPEFRYQLVNRAVRSAENAALASQSNSVGNYYEQLGLLVKMGLVDRELALDIWSFSAAVDWDLLAPLAAITRRAGAHNSWENFEYFVVLSQDWLAAHPDGSYPTGMRRIALKDDYLAADKQYAASRAPA